MDRFKERQQAIQYTFKCQYEGQVPLSSPAWQDLKTRIHTSFEILDALIAKSKRSRKDLQFDVPSPNEYRQVLHDQLKTIILEHGFPVRQNYRNTLLSWLQTKAFFDPEEELPITEEEESLELDQELDQSFVFKTYYLTSETKVTCLEEVKKMNNEEATTGLVTWQAAPALLSYISGQDFQFKKILELGSGAGLLGLGILQLLPNIQSYTFTDISPQVLNILNANVNINDAVKKRGHFSTTDLTEWLVGGPPKIFIPENVTQINQSIQRNDPRQDIFIKHLDWSSVSDEVLRSLDYDVIIGSDLTYTLSMLLPLAQLLKRLLDLKNDASVEAYIACTQRGISESISAFLQCLSQVGLKYCVAHQSIDTASCISTSSHEPMHKVFIYKIQNK
eukprot:10856.XXX_32747_33919_1 [CDS] Oithona nana genome sequencing.